MRGPLTPLKGSNKQNAEGLSLNDDAAESLLARKAASHEKLMSSPLRTVKPKEHHQASSLVPSSSSSSSAAAVELSPDSLLKMYTDCIKLATENKINHKNAWTLGLIDHMTGLVGADDGEGTNFMRASATLEASTKIYSSRVDSVHSETYRVLGGLNRGEKESAVDGDGYDGADGAEDGEDALDENGDPAKRKGKKAASRKAGIDTLEPVVDNLNVKKFDLGFDVDPLFQKTSESFDEGGAAGMLLNHLSVYQGCTLIFDSHNFVMDIPATPPRESQATEATPVADLRDLVFGPGSGAVDLAKVDVWPGFHDFVRYQEQILLQQQLSGGLGGDRNGGAAGSGLGDKPGSKRAVAAAAAASAASAAAAAASAGTANSALGADRKSLDDPERARGARGASFGASGEPILMGGFAVEDEDHFHGLLGNDDSTSHDDGFWGDDADFQEQQQFGGVGGGGSGEGNTSDDFGSGGAGGDEASGDAPLGRWSTDVLPSAARQFDIGKVVLSLADSANDYCFFDPRLLTNWAGPAHWKRFAPASGPGGNSSASAAGAAAAEGLDEAGGKDGAKKRKAKADFVLDFTAPDTTDYTSAFAHKKKVPTVLSAAALEKNSAEDTTLPADLHFTVKSLATLFLRPARMVSLMKKISGMVASHLGGGSSSSSGAAGIASAAMGGDGLWYNFANSNDAQNYVPTGSANMDDDDDGYGGGGGGGFDDADDDSIALPRPGFAAQLAMAAPTDLGLDLVEAPRKVEKISISYAKMAKKMDVKVLKESIWHELSQGGKGLAKGEAKLSEVIKELPKTVPSDIMANVNTSFCFICLLHLANEHQLVIKNDADLNELRISAGTK